MIKNYKAFISYSHKDEAFAKWLHKQIENWKVPTDISTRDGLWGTVPNNLRPVFRDRDDFSGGHSLKQATLDALQASDFLVVVCSPNSANSIYVSEEIRLFKTMGKADKVIPVIYSGEPGDPQNECFPDTVKFIVDKEGQLTDEEAEPIAPDARDQGDGKNRAVAKVVAGLLGVTFDEIIRREEKAKKNRIALLSGVGAGSVIFATIFASFALWQYHQANLAISKSVFAIGGLIQDTDTLAEDSDIEMSRESMLLAQCDLQQGLASNSHNIDFLSQSICIAEQAKSRLQIESPNTALKDIKTWLIELAQHYSASKANIPANQNMVQAYIRTLLAMLEFQEMHGGAEAQTLVLLNKITNEAGEAIPEQDYIREANESGFWWYEGLLEEQNNWSELQDLLVNTIALRQKQSDSFAYDEFNVAKTQLAELQRLFAWLQLTHLNDRENAFNYATDALSNINSLEAAYPKSAEITYQKTEILLMMGLVKKAVNELTAALTNFKKARQLLIRLRATPDLSIEALEQLDMDINQLDELIEAF